MDCFYIITNKLKDPDFTITNKIRHYIESKGKKCRISEKDGEGHIIPGTIPADAQCGLVLGGDGTLIRAVRDEFEHNVSQQIYVSSEAWVFVRNAREFMVQFINSCAVQCEPDGDSMQLAKMLLEGYASMENAPVQLALDRLHQEFKMF